MTEDNAQKQEYTGIDRRKNRGGNAPDGRERRQFRDSHNQDDPEVRELAEAIDNYKMSNRRRFITYEEILKVVKSLGYHK